MFTVDHAMICQRGGLVIQRHNEIRDLQAELLDMVCYDVQVEPALQPITGEELARGTSQAPDARLDVHCRGFCFCIFRYKGVSSQCGLVKRSLRQANLQDS